MIVAIPTVHIEATVAMVNTASELTSGRVKYGADMTCNLRVSKASEHACVCLTFSGWDFRSKPVNGAVRSLK
jgi:hypothetical protein